MSLQNYIAIKERHRELEYERAKVELKRARAELLDIELQLSKAYNGSPYLRVGRIDTLDAGIVFSAFGSIESMAELKAQLTDEDLVSAHGRCDTCGAPCDHAGCTADRSHEAALPAR